MEGNVAWCRLRPKVRISGKWQQKEKDRQASNSRAGILLALAKATMRDPFLTSLVGKGVPGLLLWKHWGYSQPKEGWKWGAACHGTCCVDLVLLICSHRLWNIKESFSQMNCSQIQFLKVCFWMDLEDFFLKNEQRWTGTAQQHFLNVTSYTSISSVTSCHQMYF